MSVVVCRLSADRMAKEGYKGLVRCTVCDHTERVNVFTCLRRGWPKHCEETMQIEKEPEAG
jgi:hypothetical protein